MDLVLEEWLALSNVALDKDALFTLRLLLLLNNDFLDDRLFMTACCLIAFASTSPLQFWRVLAITGQDLFWRK